MKFALILLTCLVGVSYQQKLFWAVSPRFNYLPVYFDQQDVSASESAPIDSQVEEDQYLDVFSRSKPQRRFFSNLFWPNLINPGSALPTTTSTIIVAVSSTLTTAVVSSCIPLAQFSTAGAAAPFTTLTTACARRRRSSAIEELTLSPTPPETEMPELRDIRTDEHPDLLSSIEPVSDSADGAGKTLTKRQNRAFNLSVTVTSTITVTNFSFAQTVVKKTVSLAAANQLQCLPAGFIVC